VDKLIATNLAYNLFSLKQLPYAQERDHPELHIN
jgi:hypothetical protein